MSNAAAVPAPAGDPADPGREKPSLVLIVDDQGVSREVMKLIVEAQGHQTVLAAGGEEAVALALAERPDLVILDLVMPGMNGYEVLRRLRGDAVTRGVPVIMVSAKDDPESRLAGLALGADDYLTRPVNRTELKVRLRNLLRMKRMQDEINLQKEVLERRIDLRAAELERSSRETIRTLIRAASYRDDDSGAHVKRIGLYASLLAERLGMDEPFCSAIGLASQLHDIGKIGIPDRILVKTGALTDEEWAVMQTHSEIGGGMLALNSSPYLVMAAEIARAHHEHFDGSGYPRGLAGEGIPLPARIVKLCDSYDTLRTRKPYKAAIGHDEAVAGLLRGDGRSSPGHFDPAVLAAFARMADSFREAFEVVGA